MDRRGGDAANLGRHTGGLTTTGPNREAGKHGFPNRPRGPRKSRCGSNEVGTEEKSGCAEHLNESGVDKDRSARDFGKPKCAVMRCASARIASRPTCNDSTRVEQHQNGCLLVEGSLD
jgi:hypothetical protein